MAEAALLARVDRLAAADYRGPAFRHIAARYPPLAGRGARITGGRWNPPESFSVLYLALDLSTVACEFRRHATRQGLGLGDFLPRTVYRYDVVLTELLDLRDPMASAAVGLTAADLGSDDLGPCQRVGEAAQRAGREGVLAPSATGAGEVLAVFMDSICLGSSIEPQAIEEWAAPTDVP